MRSAALAFSLTLALGGMGSGAALADNSSDPGSQVARGKEVFKAKACTMCHTTDGSPSTGPTMKGLWGSKVKLKAGDSVTADREYIRESILKPNASVVEGYPPIMPARFERLPEEDLEALLDFIKSLGNRGES